MSLKMQMSVSAGTEADKEKDIIDSQNKNIYNNIIPKKHENSSINCKFYETDIFNQAKNILKATSKNHV